MTDARREPEPADAPSERVVTVDGPAGSGKSTLGRRLAATLGLPFIDTGLFYRALAAAAARRGVGADDAGELEALARRLHIDAGTDPAAKPAVAVDGDVITAAELHDPASQNALLRAVSGNPRVRRALLPAQRAPATHGAVAAGRDCGTVVFPRAVLKIYLEADEELRTARRANQLQTRGAPIDVALLDAEVRARDVSDSSRPDGPLLRAADSRVIDTGKVGIDEMVATALRWCRERGLVPPPGS
ncbi:MAG: (d)CMP kinase [Candidatus Dormibacteraeota bacterium]|nr:(d)CMP kinase [Candidatus Dormibacteraeota bacterium]